MSLDVLLEAADVLEKQKVGKCHYFPNIIIRKLSIVNIKHLRVLGRGGGAPVHTMPIMPIFHQLLVKWALMVNNSLLLKLL